MMRMEEQRIAERAAKNRQMEYEKQRSIEQEQATKKDQELKEKQVDR